MKYVIIGAGAAGVNAAEIIKKKNSKGEVVIFGDERFFPYNRYQLTDFLCDSIQQEKLFYTSPEFFKEIGVKFRKGEYVKSINPEKKSIRLFHNEIVYYDRLLIATGARPWLGPVLQPYKKHIQRYYSLKDICVLKKKLPHIRECIVFGEGLSSLDLLCGLYKSGKEVTYIVKGVKPEWPLVDPELCEELYQLQKEKGIEIITGDRITTIEAAAGPQPMMAEKRVSRSISSKSSPKNNNFTHSSIEQSATAADKARQTFSSKSQNLRRKARFSPNSSIENEGKHYRVLTLKQRELTTDIVFAWDNYKPNISFIKGTGIEKKTGILVNEYLETSVEDIYAAGDCVEIYHPGLKKYWINFGWPNALEQGEIAGLNMTGQKRAYQVHETIDFNLMGKSLKARWWK